MNIIKPNLFLYLLPVLVIFFTPILLDISEPLLADTFFPVESIQVILFLLILPTVIYQYMAYTKAFKVFVETITKFGQKKEISEYEVKASKTDNGMTTYVLDAVLHANGKEHKITSRISPTLVGVINKVEPVVVHFDPMNRNKFVYYVDVLDSGSIISSLGDIYKKYKEDPSGFDITK